MVTDQFVYLCDQDLCDTVFLHHTAYNIHITARALKKVDEWKIVRS